jgi:hypothetical protein
VRMRNAEGAPHFSTVSGSSMDSLPLNALLKR